MAALDKVDAPLIALVTEGSRLMLWKVLSPSSILIGVVVAAGVLAVLWPLDQYLAPVALLAFATVSGLCELVRRLWSSTTVSSNTHKPGAGD